MGAFSSDKSSPWRDKAWSHTPHHSPDQDPRGPDEKWVTRSVKTNLSHANESWQNPVGYFQISICKWNDKRDLWNVKQIEKSRSKFTIRLAVAHQSSQHTRAGPRGLSVKHSQDRAQHLLNMKWKYLPSKGVGWPYRRLASVVYNILLNAPSKIPILTFSKFPSIYLSFKKVYSLATSNHPKV